MPRWQINVSRPVLARNRAHGTNDRPVIVRDYQAVDMAQPYTMAHGVRIDGPSVVVHGANSVWVETDGPVELIDAQPGLDQ